MKALKLGGIPLLLALCAGMAGGQDSYPRTRQSCYGGGPRHYAYCEDSRQGYRTRSQGSLLSRQDRGNTFRQRYQDQSREDRRRRQGYGRQVPAR